MGLPVGRIVCATNANDVVRRTLSKGDLTIAANVMTISPAMDIQFAYNVERMLYLISGGDTAATRRCMLSARRRPEPLCLLRAVQRVFLSRGGLGRANLRDVSAIPWLPLSCLESVTGREPHLIPGPVRPSPPHLQTVSSTLPTSHRSPCLC